MTRSWMSVHDTTGRPRASGGPCCGGGPGTLWHAAAPCSEQISCWRGHSSGGLPRDGALLWGGEQLPSRSVASALKGECRSWGAQELQGWQLLAITSPRNVAVLGCCESRPPQPSPAGTEGKLHTIAPEMASWGRRSGKWDVSGRWRGATRCPLGLLLAELPQPSHEPAPPGLNHQPHAWSG